MAQQSSPGMVDWMRGARRRAVATWTALGPGTGLQLIALVCGIAGVVLPWCSMSLQPDLRATELPLDLTGVPVPGWFTYGLACALCVAIGVAVRGLGRVNGRAVIAVLGLVLVAIGAVFVLQSVLSDFALQDRIIHDTNGFGAIAGHAGYKIVRPNPRFVLVAPITGEWNVVMLHLRWGWLFTVLGGILAYTQGARSLSAWVRRSRGTWALAGALALLAAVAVVGRSVASDMVASSAYDDIRLGDYASAYSKLSLASSLNSEQTLNPAYEQALGTVLEYSGAVEAPTALLAESRDASARRDPKSEITDLEQAYEQDPDNAVIDEAYVTAVRAQASSLKDPSMLIAALGGADADDPADDFLVGLLLEQQGDYDQAIAYFRAVVDTVPDTDVRSATFTQIALCDGLLGMRTQERADLLTALQYDKHSYNTLARSTALGLFNVGIGFGPP